MPGLADLRPRLNAFVDRLGCPICHAPLAFTGTLRCLACTRTFPVRDGVPLLTATPPPALVDLEEVSRAKARHLRRPWLRRLLYPSLTNGSFQRRAIACFLDSFASDSLIVDVGSSLTDPDARALRLDLVFSTNLDLVGDAQAMPFVDGSVDGILCTGLFEHVEQPERVASEIRRVLRPGGRAYVAAPFIQGYHPSPTDYRRYTREGLRQLLGAFEVLELRNTRGSGSALAWILADFLSELLSLGHPSLYRVVGVPIRWACLPLKYLDPLLVGNRYDHYVTSGFTAVVRKPEEGRAGTPSPSRTSVPTHPA
jgi:SAM-dependent methyltransferase